MRSEVAKVAQVRGHWERHDPLHLDSSRPKGLDLGRVVREQADRADPQSHEDLHGVGVVAAVGGQAEP